MEPIRYINRVTGQEEIEKVYGGGALKLMYGNSCASKLIGNPLARLISRTAIVSKVVGWYQELSLTKKSILPFIESYGIDASEFKDPIGSFSCFNDFFIRKLKLSARPVIQDEKSAAIPADARYLFYENISKSCGFLVKGEKFDLAKLLDGKADASRYANGSMAIARLCPTDYHRFHFPIDCVPETAELINGFLYSVNPIALRKNIHIFSENKRNVCRLQSDLFGEVLFLEIGATNVGSIHQTYQPGIFQKKGAEKGYFSFGGSSLILLFEPGKIQFDKDLLEATKQRIEIRCLMGQSMGKATA